jgi:hypothetical protein
MEGKDEQMRDATGAIACSDGAFGQESQAATLITPTVEASSNAGVSRLVQTLASP